MMECVMSQLLVLVIITLIGLANSNGQFYVGFLGYYNKDNLDFNGSCCDGEMKTSHCSDNCDLVFEVSVGGIDSAPSTGKRPSETPIDNSEAIYFPTSFEGLVNPLTFDFRKWPGTVNVTVDIYDKDATISGESSLELVDRVLFTFQHDGPSLDFIYQKQNGERKFNHSKLRMVFRYECDPSYYGNECLTDCLVHPNAKECPVYPNFTGRSTVPTDWLLVTTPRTTSQNKCKTTRNPPKPGNKIDTSETNNSTICKNNTNEPGIENPGSVSDDVSTVPISDIISSSISAPVELSSTISTTMNPSKPGNQNTTTDTSISTFYKNVTDEPVTETHGFVYGNVSTVPISDINASSLSALVNLSSTVSSGHSSITETTSTFILAETSTESSPTSSPDMTSTTEKRETTTTVYTNMSTDKVDLKNITNNESTKIISKNNNLSTEMTKNSSTTETTVPNIPEEITTAINVSGIHSSSNITDDRSNAFINQPRNEYTIEATQQSASPNPNPDLNHDSSKKDGMDYWPAILGGVLGGLAIIAIVAVILYYRKQKEAQRRQDIYNVNPKRWALEPQENGTTGKSEIALETEQV